MRLVPASAFSLLLIACAATSIAADGFFITVGGRNGEAPDGHKLEGQYGEIWVSEDAKDWERVFQGGMIKEGFNHAKNNMIRCLTYGEGRFVATGNPGAGALVSDDGRNWRHATTLEDKVGGFTLTYGEGKFVIAGAYGFTVSEDGLSWEKKRLNKHLKQEYGVGIWGKEGAGHVRKIVYGNGVFVINGEKRFGAINGDFEEFLFHEVAEEPRGFAGIVAFGDGRFVALFPSGHKTSTDGVNWDPLVIDGDSHEDFKAQTDGFWDGERFIVSGRGAIYFSKDGPEWDKVETRNSRVLTASDEVLLSRGWKKPYSISEDMGRTWETAGGKDVPARRTYYFDGTQIIGQGGG